ncbi:hypothetical protein SAMN04487928_10456 [Butyrivibrio proteoclasticus]|uniref:Uncharacterized protein n=1 Tax=Butyrivibrio proteoclasticus TaxID=43305 RepID=A0A1I5RJX3_9FIRM|nr:hypothetical protein [Butyrivibrio proteoclasticus]SFP58627.1 hypothetical protein SAMN04487928_10456 [Butyrivibrio proteoclasticus]
MSEEEMRMTYSAIVTGKDNKKIVRVSFERNGKNGKEIAEGVIPGGKIVKNNGYSPDEIAGLEVYLRANADDIISKAKVISNPLKWL